MEKWFAEIVKFILLDRYTEISNIRGIHKYIKEKINSKLKDMFKVISIKENKIKMFYIIF